jgi:hypothetical protein
MDRHHRSHDFAVTLTVACMATAMLILDISVINTALSKIAGGLSTNLSGLQWIIDATPSPWPRSCSPPDRSPTGSAANG